MSQGEGLRLSASRTLGPEGMYEWEAQKLGVLLSFVHSANNPRRDLGALGAVQYLHYGDVHAHPTPILDCRRTDLPWINGEKVAGIPRLSDGDLVIVDASEDLAGTGKSVELANVGDRSIVAGLHTIVARGRPDRWAPGFKGYLQFIPQFKQALERAATGISVYAISKRQIIDIVLRLPPVVEQEAIVGILSGTDALIAALDALIVKKRAMKQGAMQQLLTGRTRLPGFVKEEGYQRSVAGMIPGDWETVRLGDLFTFKNGLNKGKEYFGVGTPIVNYLDVFRRSWVLGSELEGRVTLSRAEIDNFSVRKGDVFFTRTSETAAEVGSASVLLDDPEDTVFSGFVLQARPKNDALDDEFKRYCFATRYVRRQIVSTSTETTRALTNGQLLSAVWIARPRVQEQRAIAAVLYDIDSEITALERRRYKTRAIKRGMMQSLLTGRVRLMTRSSGVSA